MITGSLLFSIVRATVKQDDYLASCVTVTTSDPPPMSRDAQTRIIDGAIRCFVRDGARGASMSAIAIESDVSKALLHYHFANRAHLLAEVVTTLGTRVVARERSALGEEVAASAVDVLWDWVDAEIRRGELHVLLEFRAAREPLIRQAMEQVDEVRRAAAAMSVSRTFAQLGLLPRIRVELIGDATMVFVDGLVLDHASERDTRVSFDVFWLAILSLTE